MKPKQERCYMLSFKETRDILQRRYKLNIAEAGEYRLLLCWGGPAVQIVGDLNEYNEPESANIQYQDWFTGWSNLNISQEEENILLDYARVFYFGN
jgi:hypothetical protein